MKIVRLTPLISRTASPRTSPGLIVMFNVAFSPASISPHTTVKLVSYLLTTKMVLASPPA